MTYIDVGDLLKTASAYDDLVTRTTGKTVRCRIEEELEGIDAAQVAVIDFGNVRCLDFSCADEVVAKLLLLHGKARCFLLKGVSPAHYEPIDTVLQRHELAVVAEDRNGQVHLLGPLPQRVRTAFTFVLECGGAKESEIRDHLSVSDEDARETIDELTARRLVFQGSTSYQTFANA